MLRKTLGNLPYSRPYLIVTAVCVVIFFPTWYRLAEIWLEFEQVLAHGLATAGIFLILLLIHPPKPSGSDPVIARPYFLTGAVFLIGVTLIWALLELIRIDTLAYLLLPVGVIAASWTLLGLPRTQTFLPYVLLLSLSLPFWADLIPALVTIASVVVGNWVELFGMTALIEGNSITLPWGRLIIADGCSGIRYFAISILLAALVSILNDYRWKGWLALVTAAMLIGLVANWVRIFILVVIGYETEMQSELLTDHEMLGWVVYGAFILPALYFAPARRRQALAQDEPPRRFSRKGFIAVAIALVAGPLAINLSQLTATTATPWQPENRELSPAPASRLPLKLELPDNLEHRVWQDSNGVWLSLAQSQRSAETDYKLVPYLRPTIDQQTWLNSTRENNITIYQHVTNRQKVAVFQRYQVGGYQAQRYRNAKLLQIPATLRGESRFALVTLMATCSPLDCDSAVSALSNRLATLRLQTR